MDRLLKIIYGLPKSAALSLIKIYQHTLSPDHGWLAVRHPHGYCRFYPSCSEYGYQAISRFGLLKGGWLTSKRLAKCHPFSDPKVDPVPNS